uniref:Uncharacterized protein n=1 Tax=Anguilla anguilla TaxID=7936 RepID=A0A0E9SNK2_ANGAN
MYSFSLHISLHNCPNVITDKTEEQFNATEFCSTAIRILHPLCNE